MGFITFVFTSQYPAIRTREASSSQVIKSLSIFMQPGDTTADTKLSTVFVSP